MYVVLRSGQIIVTVLGLVGGAPGGRHRASPIHRRRARAACHTCLLVSYRPLAVHTSILRFSRDATTGVHTEYTPARREKHTAGAPQPSTTRTRRLNAALSTTMAKLIVAHAEADVGLRIHAVRALQTRRHAPPACRRVKVFLYIDLRTKGLSAGRTRRARRRRAAAFATATAGPLRLMNTHTTVRTTGPWTGATRPRACGRSRARSSPSAAPTSTASNHKSSWTASGWASAAATPVKTITR